MKRVETMNVLFTTNFPSPYRIDFFNELGKNCSLTVAYERNKALHRDAKWVGTIEHGFREIYLNQKPIGTSQSLGLGIIKIIKENKFDRIILCGYASPSVILAVIYCRLFKKEYYLEFDGGFNKKDPFGLRLLKRFIFRGAKKILITCRDTEDYLNSYGIDSKAIEYYPFSSIKRSEIMEKVVSNEEKLALKSELGIKEEKAIISVGQFIHRKGFDILIKAARQIDESVGIYIVGGKVTDEYLSLCKDLNIKNVHFVPFMKKEDLFKWYKACDLFVMPTRYDIWGLVVNEAMACGLPVISSDMCIAAKELLRNNKYIYHFDDYKELSVKVNKLLKEDLREHGKVSLETIKNYTIESMAEKHMEILKLCEE